MFKMRCRIILLISFAILLAGCATPRPNNVENVCDIFHQYPKWYWQAEKTQKRWGVPVAVQMAIIHQESHFNAKIKPARSHLLWVIPWRRPSSSYGYDQALKTTWEHYQASTGKKHGRSDFASASDFIGWYGHLAQQRLGISSYDAYHLYLAYHEGLIGYAQGTYANKAWLIDVAHRVQQYATMSANQLKYCKIKKPHWWN